MSRVPLTRFNINMPNFASSNLLLSNSAEQAAGGAFKLQDILNDQGSYNEKQNTDAAIGTLNSFSDLNTYGQDRQNFIKNLKGVDMAAVVAAADSRGDLLSTREGEAYGRSQRRQEEALTAANLGIKEFELNNAPDKFAADIARTRAATNSSIASADESTVRAADLAFRTSPEGRKEIQDNLKALQRIKNQKPNSAAIKAGTPRTLEQARNEVAGYPLGGISPFWLSDYEAQNLATNIRRAHPSLTRKQKDEIEALHKSNDNRIDFPAFEEALNIADAEAKAKAAIAALKNAGK